MLLKTTVGVLVTAALAGGAMLVSHERELGEQKVGQAAIVKNLDRVIDQLDKQNDKLDAVLRALPGS